MKIRNPFLVIAWSFGLFILMHTWQYLGTVIASFVSGSSFESIISGKYENSNIILVMGLVAAFVGLPMVYIITKYLWKRDFKWMCLNINLKYFFTGILLGVILPIIIIVILLIMGNATVSELPDRYSVMNVVTIVIGYLGLSLFTAVAEETVFRAIVVREIAAKWNWIVATLIGGIYFGLVHLFTLNNLSIIDTLWIILSATIASSLFIAMYIRSKSLWLPIGFHAGWNFCLAAIIGTKMSGKESGLGIYNFNLSGNYLMTGGQFGVEASVIPFFIFLVMGILLIKYSKTGKVTLLSSSP